MAAADLLAAMDRATPEDVLAAIDAVARRPDVAAAIKARNGDPENVARAIFGEPPLPPLAGPPGHIDLRGGQ